MLILQENKHILVILSNRFVWFKDWSLNQLISSLCSIYKKSFLHFVAHGHLVLREQTLCRYVQCFTINRSVQVNLKVSSFTQLHNTSWWQWTVQRTLASFELFSQERRKIPLDYSYVGLDIQEKHFRTHLGTLQVVSFLAFLPFLPENASGRHFMHLYTPHDIIAA